MNIYLKPSSSAACLWASNLCSVPAPGSCCWQCGCLLPGRSVGPGKTNALPRLYRPAILQVTPRLPPGSVHFASIHSITHSFIHPLIHSFIHPLLPLFSSSNRVPRLGLWLKLGMGSAQNRAVAAHTRFTFHSLSFAPQTNSSR